MNLSILTYSPLKRTKKETKFRTNILPIEPFVNINETSLIGDFIQQVIENCNYFFFHI